MYNPKVTLPCDEPCIVQAKLDYNEDLANERMDALHDALVDTLDNLKEE